jgi:cobalt-zinc-cadmium efflux system membrane fusion protein
MKNYRLKLLSLALVAMLGIAGASYASQGHDDHAGDDHKEAKEESHGGHDHAEDAPAAKKPEEKHEDEDAEKDHAEEEGGEHKEGEGHKDEHGHNEKKGKLNIEKAAADAMKIEVMEAGPATVRVSIPVTGKISLNKNTIAQVRARFDGVVKSVAKTQGEMVQAGETLATVESNESLQAYPVKSPIGGMILERNTNVGHVTGDENLFEVANLATLWVQFHVFPKDMHHVEQGQKVRVAAVGSNLSVETSLASILPVADSASQTVMARGEIDNKEGKWRPGMSVHGEIFVNEKQAPVAIRTAAVQRMEGKTVIYVQEGESYEARTVRLGVQDGEWAEVLEGLNAGERYVASNSFVLKAHAGKSEAEHVH